ncbi:MAG: transcription antitermination factor NusB [Actinomycetaceae bacterium]|nr:transcription antitermination factor NusB [Actinomycetaceae bacterium]
MTKKKQFTGRTKARKRAVEVLFEAQIKGRDTYEGLMELASMRSHEAVAQTPIPAYARTIVEGIAIHLDRIDSALANYSQGWDLDRMPGVDLAVLRIGVWEILYNDEVDAPIAIDEAVTLVRALSTDDSPNFVNGLLGRIADLADSLR